MKNGKLLAGVLAGLGTGALLGILFAPGKGSSTRRKISKAFCHSKGATLNLHNATGRKQQQEEADLLNSIM